MLGVQALGSSVESSRAQDSGLKVGLEPDWKLMDLANDDAKEEQSSEVREVEEHETQLKQQPLKVLLLLLLPLPLGQVPVWGELELEQQQQEEEVKQQQQGLEEVVELEREQQEVENQPLLMVNEGDAVPLHLKGPPSNQRAQ